MAIRLTILVTLFALIAVDTADAQVITRFGKTRPGVICCVPQGANYQIGDRSPSTSAYSFGSVFLGDPSPATPATSTGIQQDRKLFQWSEDSLQIDHCAVSEMALQLNRNGVWVLNVRADQNRMPPPGVATPFNPRLHIKRNRFALRLRCYGMMETTPPETGLETGKPVMAAIDVKEFWVENGQPKFLLASNYNRWIGQNFDLIDRVEIEFFYYK